MAFLGKKVDLEGEDASLLLPLKESLDLVEVAEVAESWKVYCLRVWRWPSE